ncbi:MAG: type VI-B CRISPR-associated RNA-guided ribonuclease Cas13b [Prevotella sp.]|nr:type VI-B CRISPR-associated RNA-guided ribonuclease Cas13b [Prevotella sp.]
METPRLIEEKKKYFGTYAVMALLNAQTVLDHIQKIAGIESPAMEKPEDLWEHPVMKYLYDSADNRECRPEVRLFVMEKLQEYFPFLKIMAENQRDHWNRKNSCQRLEVNSSDIRDVLNMIFRVLKKYRDITTHFMARDNFFDDGSKFLTGTEHPLTIILNKYYDVALRNIKEKYCYTTEDLAFIQNYRMKSTRTPDGGRRMMANVDFFMSIVAYNGDKSGKLHLSGMGVALLICLLLDKQYINLFVSRLPIPLQYKNQQEVQRIISRSMGIHSIKLPKDRIQMDKDSTSVAMDMLNEVKRCPNELFETLSVADMSRFRIMSSDYNEVLQKRSSDRFAQLLLQYIDYGQLFRKIRFHVNMGKLRYLFNAEKSCIDGNTRVRVLEHPLNGFGRIEEMEALRKNEDNKFANTSIRIREFEDMKRDDAAPDSYPYIVDTRSHYILENNKVEMSFAGNHVLPVIEEENGKWYVGKETPTCRISTLELPAMAFHMLLFGSEKTEERIMQVYGQYKRLFDAMRKGDVNKDNIAGFGIAECDLPKKALDSLDGCAQGKDIDSFVRKTVEELRVDTSRRLERLRDDKDMIRSRDNKMGKRNFRKISTGVLADFLAKDIVRFLPTESDGMKKLTGLNYRILQSSIAVYDSAGDNEAKVRFKQLFEKALLIGTDPNRNHPFIHKVFARTIPENAVEFYERYLVERRAYLEKLFMKVCKGTTVNVPFINRNQKKWKDSTQEYLGQVYGKDLAVELPRQMFDADIKECLRQLPQMADIDFNRANVTYLIGEYIKRVLNDDFQGFYFWKRSYCYMDMLKGNYDRKGKLCNAFTTTAERETLWKERDQRIEQYRACEMKKSMTARRSRTIELDDMESILDRKISAARVSYQKNEKTIRRYKVQDALLFLMAKQKLTGLADFDGTKFNLKDIMPDADRGILSEIMPMTFTFEKGGKRYTITSEGMKLKNYGDFFVLANDKRLTYLMTLIGKDAVSKEKLTEEFSNYNQCRPEVAQLVFDLEKWAFDTYPKLKGLVLNGEKVGFYKIMEMLCNDRKIDKQQSDILRKIRNAFEHNSYPEQGIVEITTLPEVAENMERLFGRYAIIR